MIRPKKDHCDVELHPTRDMGGPENIRTNTA